MGIISNMKNLRQLLSMSFSIFLLAILFLAGFFLINQLSKNFKIEEIKYIKIAGQKIKVDLALTDDARVKGLSGRVGLPLDQGMLFVFDRPDKYFFWMKDMNFPIDMIWINENMKIVHIEKKVEPSSYPSSFGPKENTKYVLEVVSGFSSENNLKEGGGVEFIY